MANEHRVLESIALQAIFEGRKTRDSGQLQVITVIMAHRTLHTHRTDTKYKVYNDVQNKIYASVAWGNVCERTSVVQGKQCSDHHHHECLAVLAEYISGICDAAVHGETGRH